MRVMVLTMAPDPRSTRMARLYRDGKSIRQVAVACGCSPKTVHRQLIASGVPLRPPGGVKGRRAARQPLTTREELAAAAAYQGDRASLHSLGVAYGVSGDTMARRLRARGTEIRPRGRPLAAGSPAEPSGDVLRLHSQGLRPRDIAAKLGRSDPAEIARQLRAAGLTPHRCRPIPARAELAAAYADAGSVRALARRYQVAEDRLRKALGDTRTARRRTREAGTATVSPGMPATPESRNTPSSGAVATLRIRVA